MVIIECDGCRRGIAYTEVPHNAGLGFMQFRFDVPRDWFYRFCTATQPRDLGHGRQDNVEQCVFLLACNKHCQTLAVEKAKLRYLKFKVSYGDHKTWLGGPDR